MVIKRRTGGSNDRASPPVKPLVGADLILDTVHHAIITVASDLRIVTANRSATELAAQVTEEKRPSILDTEVTCLFPESVRESFQAGCHELLDGKRGSFSLDVPYEALGRVFEVVCNRTVDSQTPLLVVVIAEVTEAVRSRSRIEGLRRVTRALARADELGEALDAIALEAPGLLGADRGAIFMLDDQDRLVAANGWGLEPEVLRAVELLDEKAGSLALWAIRGRRPVAIPDVTSIPGVESELVERTGIRAAIGVPLMAGNRPRGVLLLAYSVPRLGFTPEEMGIAESLGDETATALERADLVIRLHKEALTDPLTGLSNRRAFEEALARHHAQAVRLERPFSVMLVDMDNMKRINDRLGHGAGDAALKATARALVIATRAGDLVARVGGDEFSVLLTDADSKGARLVVERLTSVIAASDIDWRGETLPISVSAGAATWPDQGPSVDQLLLTADEALYRVKAVRRAGRDYGADG